MSSTSIIIATIVAQVGYSVGPIGDLGLQVLQRFICVLALDKLIVMTIITAVVSIDAVCVMVIVSGRVINCIAAIVIVIIINIISV